MAFIRLDIFVKTELQKWLDWLFEDQQKPPEIIIQGFFFLNHPKYHQKAHKNQSIYLSKTYKTALSPGQLSGAFITRVFRFCL
jgi:hypothetical protein